MVRCTKKISADNEIGETPRRSCGSGRSVMEERRLSHYKLGISAGHWARPAVIVPA
jgi:hypothetical protein